MRRYFDSVPPETPIRDVVDRCRIWESHADPIYPAHAVGDSDKVVEEIRVAAVTKSRSPPDQVEDLLRRLLAGVAPPALVPAPVPEVPMVEKLVQRLVAETQIRQRAPVVAPEPAGLETLLRSLLSGQSSFRRDWNDIVCFSCGKAGHSANRCSALDESFPFMLPGWRAEWLHHDFASGGGGS